MTSLNLPEPIAAYFQADQQSPHAVAGCFTAQAVVQDEGQRYSGRDAIAAWKTEAAAQYTYTTEPKTVEQRDDGCHVVTSHVVGDFPGSPVDLKYRFRLERGLIASLEITA